MKVALRRWPYALAAILALLAASLLPDIFRGEAPSPEDPPDAPPPTGRVMLAPGDIPLPGAVVTVTGSREQEETIAGTGGEFRFDPVPAGAKEVVVRYGALTVRMPWRATGLEVRLSGEFAVGGRVIADSTGDPVVGAEVLVGSVSAVSGERGTFRLEGLRLEDPGLAKGAPPTIRVEAPGYVPFERPLLPADSWADLFVRLVRK